MPKIIMYGLMGPLEQTVMHYILYSDLECDTETTDSASYP
jgi:hypothetical protein